MNNVSNDGEPETAVADLIKQTEALVESGNYRSARRSATELLNFVRTADIRKSSRARAFHVAGVAAYHSQEYAEAIERLQSAADFRQTEGPPVEFGESLRELGAAFRANGQLAEAEEHYGRALIIFRDKVPADGAHIATLLNNLAILYYHQSRIAESEQTMREALAVRIEALGPNASLVGQSYSNLGEVLLGQGRLEDARASLEAGLRIRETTLPPDHPDVAASLSNLAVLHYERGEYGRAEQILRRVVEIDTAAYGPGTLEVALDLQNLAEAWAKQRRLGEAEAAHRQVLAIRRQKLPVQHPDLAVSLSNLANILGDMGKRDEAIGLYMEALGIDRAIAEGKPSLAVAADLNDIGDLRRQAGELEPALAMFVEALGATEALGSEGRLHGSLLNNIADIYTRLGRRDEAEICSRRIVALRRRVLPPDHPDLALSLSQLSGLVWDRGDRIVALELGREARDIVAGRITRQDIGDAAAATVAETRLAREVLITHARLVAQSGQDVPGYLSRSGSEELLFTIQLAQASDTSLTIAKMAGLHSLGDDPVARLLTKSRDLRLERKALQRAALDASTVAETTPLLAAFDGYRERLSELEAELSTAESAVPPHITRRLSFEPVSLDSLRRVLKKDEALLTVLIGKRFCVSLLIAGAYTRAHVANVGSDEISGAVAEIRSSLNMSGGIRALPAFDVKGAEKIYREFFEPFADTLMQIGHLIYVPDQILEGIPPAILPIGGEGTQLWLGDRVPVSMLPAISSLCSLRVEAGRSAAPEAFLGFGASLVPEGSPTSRLGHLPRAAEQLEAICNGVGGDEIKILTGAAVTRLAVMTMDLRRYRVLAFATHGLVAGETAALGGPAEAALLLSPQGGDTGLLTASDIAGLDLDADWVILSACNSAAPDGTFGAEGLSGLAKAFFEAGARSLLVSHWSVSEWTTTRLLASLFKHLTADPSISRAAALASAMREVRSEGLASHRHPAFWGAFAVVGEGVRPD